MANEHESMRMRAREMRDLASRSRRAARTVPTQWVIDTLNQYARELEEKAGELENRADGGDGTGEPPTRRRYELAADD